MSPTPDAGASGLSTSTVDAEGIARQLKSATRVVITTHAKPDGDAVGSALALARAIMARGAVAEAWFAGPFPDWLGEVCGTTPTVRLNADTPVPVTFVTALGEPDAVVVVDTGSWIQVEHLRAWLAARYERSCVIDHHVHGDADLSPHRYVQTQAAATTELVTAVIEALLDLRPTDPIPPAMAPPLYLGLATDTGWFRFSNTTPTTLRLAARLMDSGVDAPRLYQMVEQRDSRARPKLLGRALSSLEYHPLPSGGLVGIMTLTQTDLASCGGGSEDTGRFSEPVMAVSEVKVVAVLTEMSHPGEAQPLTKISLRSKPGMDAIDVAAVAAALRGGGHARAAGVKLGMDLARARATILDALGVTGP
jgi:phosphoesterase RecJ-like protein